MHDLLFCHSQNTWNPRACDALGLVVEKLKQGAVKPGQSLHLIAYAVGMNNIHEHPDPSLWAASIRWRSSSGVPNLDDGAKKLETW